MKQLTPTYNINALMNECISQYLDTFVLLQDTPDYLPPTALAEIVFGISKEMKRTWKSLHKFDKRYQKHLKFLEKQSRRKRSSEASEPASPPAEPPKEEQLKETLPVEAPKKEVQENAK